MPELTPEYIGSLKPTRLIDRLTELREKSGLSRDDFYFRVERCMQHLHESIEEAAYATYWMSTSKDPVLSDRYLWAARREIADLPDEE